VIAPSQSNGVNKTGAYQHKKRTVTIFSRFCYSQLWCVAKQWTTKLTRSQNYTLRSNLYYNLLY